MRTLTRNPHRFGRMRNRPPLTTNPLNDQTTTMNREPTITVPHEDLRWVDDSNHHSTRRSSPTQTVTNVPAEYN
jgi:hypothetical protein